MRRIFFILAIPLVVCVGIIVIRQFLYVQKAHSSFANYYAFRGCSKLLQKTDTWATCALSDGKTIKMVNVNNKWYLDGDLPVCYFTFCF
ncbi:MAG: hypothetical protein KGJ07_08985 [Patescibacteria group bacterium]|nr:hypothetical protein [Patescibacteria group bacterium]